MTGPQVVALRPVLPDTAASFPNDQPTGVVLAAIREIRRELAHIEAALRAVEAELVVPEPAEPATKAVWDW